MNDIQEVDTVLQHVLQAAQRHCVPSDAAITQQILLLGDSFYGYRFTAANFTAIWSAVDQTIKIDDREGHSLEIIMPTETAETVVEVLPLPLHRRAA